MIGLIQGNAKSLPLADGVIQMCVTSPPYFGLRDYGVNDQIGLEQTPNAYVAELVAVFREVWRVMKDDGTLWLNLGDSYAASQSNNGGYSNKSTLSGFSRPDTKGRQANETGIRRKLAHGVKPKDLIGIPWRVAFALQSDGWYLRQDIIWHKPNPMPESVRDRCTKAHEYIFLLAKSERYFFDSEAMKESATSNSSGAAASFKRSGSKRAQAIPNQSVGTHREDREDVAYNETRNRRSVWTVPTSPYSGAHFATFPPALIEPCILAGSRVGDIVLDPFSGSGTTAAVSKSLGRSAVGVELNQQYLELASRRVGDAVYTPSLFA